MLLQLMKVRVVSPESCAGSLIASVRGLASLILRTKTSRNVKRNPRFHRPDFFQDICRYSHIKLKELSIAS